MQRLIWSSKREVTQSAFWAELQLSRHSENKALSHSNENSTYRTWMEALQLSWENWSLQIPRSCIRHQTQAEDIGKATEHKHMKQPTHHSRCSHHWNMAGKMPWVGARTSQQLTLFPHGSWHKGAWQVVEVCTLINTDNKGKMKIIPSIALR